MVQLDMGGWGGQGRGGRVKERLLSALIRWRRRYMYSELDSA
jgi:hypothetical protein